MSRRPLGAKRDGAERYLLLTIAAFAVTVAGVRWYLDIAGYPTIGGGGLHVAHVLWGGLLLTIAVLVPILFVGQRALLLSALLAGVGMGLFIDEVGKVLTTTNDYFFAPAAPIIYGGVLLLVLLWLIVRRTGDNAQDAAMALVTSLGDAFDGNLTSADRDRVLANVRTADGSPNDDPLVASLVSVLGSSVMDAHLADPGWIASGRARRLLERVLPTRFERIIVLFLLIWAALQAVVALLVLVVYDEIIVGGLEALTDAAGRIEVPTEPLWLWLVLVVAMLVGIGSAAAVVLSLRGREVRAMDVALAATLLNLVAGGLVSFYAVQIAALASTVIHLLLLGLVIDYRGRVLRSVAAGTESNVVDAEVE